MAQRLCYLRLLLFLFPVAAAIAGCGPSRPETAYVTGVVTVDGKPIEGAAVMFSPSDGGRPARGTTDAAGRFELTTFESGDGAIVGKHRISVAKLVISGLEEAPGGGAGLAPEGIHEQWFTPIKYANPDTSGLSADVQHGLEPLQLQLVSD